MKGKGKGDIRNNSENCEKKEKKGKKGMTRKAQKRANNTWWKKKNRLLVSIRKQKGEFFATP